MQKLKIFQSLWGMEQRHPHKKEPTLKENFKKAKLAGFDGICVDLSEREIKDFEHSKELFDEFEMNFENQGRLITINEMYAIGPAISILMKGYVEGDNLVSLRGTLVPAKTLNKIISKIPIIGDLIIPKEVGEGLFGISFKMKGPPGKIKTSINPIRTLTPRFIQKIIDKKKKTK